MPTPRMPGNRRERQALTFFGISLVVLVGTWFGFFSLRAPIWSEDIKIIPVAGLFRIFGDRTSDLFSTFLLLVIVSLAYLGCLAALRRGFPRSFPVAMAGCVLAALAVLPVTPLTSPDVTHLAADVRTLWLHGQYPAVKEGAPDQIDDPVARQVVVFKSSPSGYGPLAYAIGGIALPFVGDNFRANIAGQKAVAGAFLVLTALFTGLVARRLGYNPGLAAAAVGLNPLMLWQFPADGHNDAIMAAFGMLALLLVLRDPLRDRAAGLLSGLASFAAKYALAVALPLVAAYWFRRYRWARPAAAGLVGVGGALAAMLVIVHTTGGTGTIGPATGLTQNTPWARIADAVDADLQARRVLFAVSYVLLAIIAATIIIRHRLETPRDLVAAIGLLMFLFAFVASPSLRHWYQLWYLPFALLSGRRWLIAASLTFTLSAFLTILALNWQVPIIAEMGIKQPIEKSVWLVWILTGGAALITWRVDIERGRRLAQAEARRQQRPGARRPARGKA
ncbi:MAG: hypothetical protein HYX53_09085 [Chloroflexi bacterium]|nr:hypothetical protein [Chloroflexota bacterium]